MLYFSLHAQESCWGEKTKKEWSQELIDSLNLKQSDNVVMFNKPFDKGLIKESYKQQIYKKPDGVWYSCGKAWLDWVFYEMSGWLGDYIYKLKIDKSNFVRLRTKQMLLDFTEGYTRTKIEGDLYSRDFGDVIDWPLLQKLGYDGIEICPYLSDARFEKKTGWYYTWDVASGCVWNTTCIKDVSIIEF